MLRLLRYLTKREWALAAVSILFIVAQIWMELTMPDYMSEITTLLQRGGSTPGEILRSGGMMLLCALGSIFAAMVTAVCAAGISASCGRILRGKLFAKVQSFSMEEIGRFSTASLITRSTNDVTQVQTLLVMGLQTIAKAPIMAVWAIWKIAGKGWEWTLATGIAVLLLLAVLLVCLGLAVPKYRNIQVLTDEINRVTRENLTGLKVIRAYNAEEYQEQKFEHCNEKLTHDQLFAMRAMAFVMPTMYFVMSALTLAVYWIGAVLINQAGMTEKITLFSDMVVFSQYAMQVIMSFMILVSISMSLPRAAVSAKRILEVLETKPAILDGSRTQGVSGKAGEVEFQDVTFQYPDAEQPVLSHISFTAKPGETVAIIGSTGCGKSTIVNLIPRFYEATQGQVLVDGGNVKDYSQRALRNKIGYVSQTAALFTGTIRSNIAFGENGKEAADDATIRKAAETAQASEFIETMDGGYNGFVAQGGANLSGGQKQRLSIARAIARKPEILIFDDSFSALDYKTDKILRRALERECRDTTRIIVAQRIGTIRDADKILVLDKGRLVGTGTHEELMKNCAVYQQIALSQLSKEELA